MYSDKKNILQLVALLKAHGIQEAVLCPGSRNTPIVHTMSANGDFTCYAMTDERSAGFFAIGLAQNSSRPVAVCCTSGSALLNLHPAVAEAFYQHIPLVVISADRPSAWIGQMDGQTVPQPGVFRDLVKKSVDLPEIRTAEDEWYCNRLINEALLETNHHGKGPVHLNIPISEPLFQFTVEKLPEVRVIKRYDGLNADNPQCREWIERIRRYRQRLIIAGQQSPGDQDKSLQSIGNEWVRFVEHIGNPTAGSGFIGNFDALLYALPKDNLEQMAPELLITYGGHIVSKRLKKFLRKYPAREHIHVTPDGTVVDLYGSLTTVVEMAPAEFIRNIVPLLAISDDTDYSQRWKRYSEMIPQPNFAFSEMSAIGTLIQSLPAASVLHLGNSSTIRYAQLYTITPSVEVYGNRGTNGIEGSLSVAAGFAASSGKLNFMVIGDLSFFYDMNALWNTNIRSNLRILLLNNGGGEIFHTLPGLELSGASHPFVTSDHDISAKGWAEECGFEYLCADNEAQLSAAMAIFTRPESLQKPFLLEVFTDKEADARILKEYYHQLKQI